MSQHARKQICYVPDGMLGEASDAIPTVREIHCLCILDISQPAGPAKSENVVPLASSARRVSCSALKRRKLVWTENERGATEPFRPQNVSSRRLYMLPILQLRTPNPIYECTYIYMYIYI